MTKRAMFHVLFLAASLAVFAQQQPVKPAPKLVYVRAGHLFDATSDSVKDNMVIVILGDRIQSVGPALAVTIPAGATIVESGDRITLAAAPQAYRLSPAFRRRRRCD